LGGSLQAVTRSIHGRGNELTSSSALLYIAVVPCFRIVV